MEYLIVFMLVSNIAAFAIYIKERLRREKAEDRLHYVVTRAEAAYTWCGYEFPQIGHAILFALAYDANQSHLKEAMNSDHNGGVDQFRDSMRYKYKTKESDK